MERSHAGRIFLAIKTALLSLLSLHSPVTTDFLWPVRSSAVATALVSPQPATESLDWLSAAYQLYHLSPVAASRTAETRGKNYFSKQKLLGRRQQRERRIYSLLVNTCDVGRITGETTTTLVVVLEWFNIVMV